MPFPQPRLVLSLALGLLWPAAAFAQTPAAPPDSAPPQVQVKVAFARVSTADLDRSGVTFDRVPLASPTAKPAPEGTSLRYVTGSAATRLFQALLHTRGKIVQAPLATTPNNVGATVQICTQVPDGKAGFLAILTGLTITPRVNSDDSVTLFVAPEAADGNTGTPATGPQATILRTIRSGDMMALDGSPFSSGKPVSGQELLVFVTPTIVGTDAQKAEAGEPSPPAQDAPTMGKTISLDVTAGDLRAVVAMLERQVGLKASVQDGDKPFKPVYVHLDGVSLAKALRTIAWSAGAKVTKTESSVYVFSPLPDATRTPLPPPAAPPGVTGPSVVFNGSSVTVTP